MKKVTLFVLAAVGAALLMEAPPAQAVVTGKNPDLTAAQGKVYIPLQSAASGKLGGAKKTGLKQDSLRLGTSKKTSSGQLSFIWTFNLKELAGQVVDLAKTKLSFTVSDVDFKPAAQKDVIYSEIMSLSPLAKGQTSAAPRLVLGNANYGKFRPDGFGETNSTITTYTIDLKDLQLSGQEIASINAAEELSLLFTLTSSVSYQGSGKFTLKNMPEIISDGKLTAVSQVPEPVTVLTVIAGGLPCLLRRRRK